MLHFYFFQCFINRESCHKGTFQGVLLLSCLSVTFSLVTSGSCLQTVFPTSQSSNNRVVLDDNDCFLARSSRRKEAHWQSTSEYKKIINNKKQKVCCDCHHWCIFSEKKTLKRVDFQLPKIRKPYFIFVMT